MSSNHFMKRIASAAVALLSVTTLHATPMVFFGEQVAANGTVSGTPVVARNAFLKNLTGVGTENFEGFTLNSETPPYLPGPLDIKFKSSSAADIKATLGGTGAVVATSANDLGRFNTSSEPGSKQWWESGDNFTIDFDSPISAFGFYGTDIGDFSGHVTVTLTPAGGGVANVITINNTITAPTDNGALLFWGFYDTETPYKSIAFGNTESGFDAFGFDDMVVGDRDQVRPIPEPATLLLTGLGLVGLAASRRKQRH